MRGQSMSASIAPALSLVTRLGQRTMLGCGCSAMSARRGCMATVLASPGLQKARHSPGILSQDSFRFYFRKVGFFQ